jgi:membrane protein DedA with SNARE-associated domain
MEFINQEALSYWLTHYGAFAMFCLLALEIIALPIPGETLMVLAGMFIHRGDLSWHGTFIGALAGTISGVTVSYFLGLKMSSFLMGKHGSKFGFTEARVKKAHDWFARFGKWTLAIGYFIPGIRHLTGILAGMSRLEYHAFAAFAYLGAFFWVFCFLFVGYYFGECWLGLIEKISLYFTI